MSLENRNDHSSEEADKPKSSGDKKSVIGKSVNRALLAAGLALSSPAFAQDNPEAAERIQMQKQQLDKEIAENAGVLEALRGEPNPPSSLGATGLNPETMKGIGGLIGVAPLVPMETRVPPAPKPTVVSSAPSNDKVRERVQMQKQQLDKEIAENAGVLEALRGEPNPPSSLGATGLNPETMKGIGGLIGAAPSVPIKPKVPDSKEEGK